jgi:HD-like signal output (HDOD) protein/ActR/RegA family two-component response regulator
MKKRVLFVEDEPLLLQMYASMLDEESDRWEVLTAVNAQHALQVMEAFRFDVIVSDLMMPGMDGAELMNEVKKRYPRASRIMLSVSTDQEKVARCLGATHQFISKPFDVKVLKAALAGICGLDAYLQDPKLQALVGRLGTLPSFPSLYTEIMKELSSPNSSIESISTIISRDPAMTAKMLQIVNSAAIGLARKVSSPFEAVEYLGLGTVRSLVLSAHIFSCFQRQNLPGLSITRLWDHALKTSMIARRITVLEWGRTMDADETFTAGMLHDVGKLMLADNLPEEYQRVLTLAGERKISLPAAELEVLGGTHAGVAAYLLGLWGLPGAIVEAVAFHHAPRNCELRAFSPLTAVHVANVFEQEFSETAPPGPVPELDENYLASVHVLDRLPVWRTEARQLLSSPKQN